MQRRPGACNPLTLSSRPPPPLPALPPPQADSLEEAIRIVNANEHGNGTALFTRSGAAARKFQHDIDVGMVRGAGVQRERSGAPLVQVAARPPTCPHSQRTHARTHARTPPPTAHHPPPPSSPHSGGHQHPHPSASALLLLHRLARLLPWRPADVRQDGRAVLHAHQDGCVRACACGGGARAWSPGAPRLAAACLPAWRQGAACPRRWLLPATPFLAPAVTQSWKDHDPEVIPGLAGVGASPAH